MEWFGVGIVVLFLAYFAYSVIRHGGFRGAMFGARIVDTIGEVEGADSRLSSTRIKVHILEAENSEPRRVGIEVVMTSLASWASSPITLSQSQARELAGILERAAA